MNPTIQTIIAITAIGISLFTLGWNIFRDVIQKPRLKVKLQIRKLVSLGNNEYSPMKVIISATNFGPRSIKCLAIHSKVYKDGFFNRLFGRLKYKGFLICDYKEPLSEKLPKRLEVGDGADWMFDYNDNCFLKESFNKIGITDTFGRTHWAPKQDIIETRKRYNDDFVSKTKK